MSNHKLSIYADPTFCIYTISIHLFRGGGTGSVQCSEHPVPLPFPRQRIGWEGASFQPFSKMKAFLILVLTVLASWFLTVDLGILSFGLACLIE